MGSSPTLSIIKDKTMRKIHILPNGRKCHLPCDACKGVGVLGHPCQGNPYNGATKLCVICKGKGYWEADDRNAELNRKKK